MRLLLCSLDLDRTPLLLLLLLLLLRPALPCDPLLAVCYVCGSRGEMVRLECYVERRVVCAVLLAREQPD